MAARTGLNKNNSAVKRIMQEARELANDPSTEYTAAPLENDIFEWHCTLRGPSGTEFEGGLYHFRILLPSEYPFRPPSIMMLTPNGRFELNTKICISFTSYHEELWQPAWGVRTAIIGLQGFFPLRGTAAVGVGALEYPPAERKRLAALSREWVCPTCGMPNHEALPDAPTAMSSAPATSSTSDRQTGMPETSATITSVKLVTAGESSPAPPQSGTSQASTAPRHLPILAPTPTRPQPPVNIVAPPETEQAPQPSQPAISATDNKPRSPISSAESVSSGDSEVVVQISSPPRPPVVFDMAICALLVCVFALVFRRIF